MSAPLSHTGLFAVYYLYGTIGCVGGLSSYVLSVMYAGVSITNSHESLPHPTTTSSGFTNILGALMPDMP